MFEPPQGSPMFFFMEPLFLSWYKTNINIVATGQLAQICLLRYWLHRCNETCLVDVGGSAAVCGDQ